MNKILNLFEIDIIFFKELLKIIESRYIGSDKKFIYCFEYNLILILHVKNDLNNWKTLQSLIICENNYKSVYNQFLRWCKRDIFKKAYENNIIKNIDIINKDDEGIIDSTCINNKYGSENISLNPEYKKKKVTKISMISRKNKIIIGIEGLKLNEKIINFRGKEKKMKMFEHDSKSIQRTINSMKNEIRMKRLIGDGGYKTKDEIKHNGLKIEIITPNRKNQKNFRRKTDNRKL